MEEKLQEARELFFEVVNHEYDYINYDYGDTRPQERWLNRVRKFLGLPQVEEQS